ncbi:RrF2 family transcriptional regulator [Clostridium felsineum]|uniref:HTH-type transcriptional regulator CymR n=1 Tax=Clostridium felsineum TaxID=36839 RepID=A0A1S8L9Q2_9CLOT|nr:Rrf2 family transcriptional regulator [Clostridium felsineum]MCR3757744.1 Rrf2 family transcriptional regulator [Clostridium felsineum]URZ01008.1 HTH-type transcriptional regulator CymR [Clostridium felsineum]URZ06242.1 HTH-type transcriptional regulator CymR [Clostridium felsineum]URZ11277.1 HTH-type transcriptional regulator CymR [Clostridium felsineum]URZ15942.1 HTH-type transcriptional regulator CymR [Clostridium felsineum DSM 794]
MKISTKGRYGLKAMIDLAVNSVNDIVTLKSISQRENISEGYLEQIFSSLRKKGLVKGRKGSQGGYVLGKSMKDITVADILNALEGDLSVVERDENEILKEDKLDNFIRGNVWTKINTAIEEVVVSITLEDLVINYNNVLNSSYMYYI